MLFYAFLILLYLFNSFYIFCMLFYAFSSFFNSLLCLTSILASFLKRSVSPCFPGLRFSMVFPCFPTLRICSRHCLCLDRFFLGIHSYPTASWSRGLQPSFGSTFAGYIRLGLTGKRGGGRHLEDLGSGWRWMEIGPQQINTIHKVISCHQIFQT